MVVIGIVYRQVTALSVRSIIEHLLDKPQETVGAFMDAVQVLKVAFDLRQLFIEVGPSVADCMKLLLAEPLHDRRNLRTRGVGAASESPVEQGSGAMGQPAPALL